MAASHYGFCMNQQMLHIIILFHDCSMIKDKRNNNANGFVIFSIILVFESF
jgi:hypothetical protein